MPFYRTCGITETWTPLTWLNCKSASDVKPLNVSRAVMLRKRKSVTWSAPCAPVNATCGNHTCSRIRSCRRHTVHRRIANIDPNCCPYVCRQRSRPSSVAAMLMTIMTVTRLSRVAPCPSIEVSWFAKNPYFHHGLSPCSPPTNTRNINGLSKVGRHPPAAEA